jgi:hypothetical protein
MLFPAREQFICSSAASTEHSPHLPSHPCSYHHNLMTTLPNEILDGIVDAAVEGLSTRTVFRIIFTPELVTLLKEIALVSHHLRESAQRHLFQGIRLSPSLIWDEHGRPATRDTSLSIFENNPRLLAYPRSLAIVDTKRARVVQPAFSPHFLSVTFPFFTSRLRNLDHLCVSTEAYYHWERTVPSDFKDALVGCITGNNLKSLTIRRFSLPLDLVKILPPTLEALHIGATVSASDGGFAAKYIKPEHLNVANTARPFHMACALLSGQWIPSQGNDLFTRIKSLHIDIMTIASPASFLSRMAADKLTHLSFRHQAIAGSKSSHPPSVDKFFFSKKANQKCLS